MKMGRNVNSARKDGRQNYIDFLVKTCLNLFGLKKQEERSREHGKLSHTVLI